MSASLFALASLAATSSVSIAIHVAELGELTIREALPLAESLAKSIEARTGRRTVVDDPAWSCEVAATCANEVRAHTGAGDVVLARIFGGATRVHVLLDRDSKRVDFFVPLEEGTWRPILDRAAADLFEAAAAPPAAALVPIAVPPPAPEKSRVVPFLALGTGVLAASVGFVFAASNASAREEIRAGPRVGSDYDELASRAETHGIAADVLFCTAVLSAAAGVLLLVVD